MSRARFPTAVAALQDVQSTVERWLDAYGASLLRVPRPVDLDDLRPRAQVIAEALAGALGEAGCRPGAPVLRETEKRFAFEGGTLAARSAASFDLVAFVYALRDVLAAKAAPEERTALRQLFDWFCGVAFEGYASSRDAALVARHRDVLEKGTPVVLTVPDVPAVFFVGEPDRLALDTILGRFLLATIQVDARGAIMDAAGLSHADDVAFLAALGAFSEKAHLISKCTLFVAGVSDEHQAAWRGALARGPGLSFEARFEDAFQRALEVSRYRLVPRGS